MDLERIEEQLAGYEPAPPRDGLKEDIVRRVARREGLLRWQRRAFALAAAMLLGIVFLKIHERRLYQAQVRGTVARTSARPARVESSYAVYTPYLADVLSISRLNGH